MAQLLLHNNYRAYGQYFFGDRYFNFRFLRDCEEIEKGLRKFINEESRVGDISVKRVPGGIEVNSIFYPVGVKWYRVEVYPEGRNMTDRMVGHLPH